MITIAHNSINTAPFPDSPRSETVKAASGRIRTFANKPLVKAFAKASMGVAGTFAVKSAAVSLASTVGWGAVAAAATGGAAVTTYSAVKDYRAQRAQEEGAEKGFWAFLKGFFSFVGQNKSKYLKKLAINSGLGIVGAAGLAEFLIPEAFAAPLDLNLTETPPEGAPESVKLANEGIEPVVLEVESVVEDAPVIVNEPQLQDFVEASYEVRTGDKLWTIVAEQSPALNNAEILNKINTIVELNGLTDANMIYPGQVLLLNALDVPAVDIVAEAMPEPPLVVALEQVAELSVDTAYEVRAGDKLWTIVAERSPELSNAEILKKIDAIAALNGLTDAGAIRPGQILQLDTLVADVAPQPPAVDVLALADGEYAACDAKPDSDGLALHCVFDESMMKTGQGVPVQWTTMSTDVDLYYIGGNPGLPAFPAAPAESGYAFLNVVFSSTDMVEPIDCTVSRDDAILNLSCRFTNGARYMHGPIMIDIPGSSARMGLEFDFKFDEPPARSPQLYTQNASVLALGR